MTDDVAERHLSLLLSAKPMGRESLQHKCLRGDGDFVRALRGVNYSDSARGLPCEGEKAAPDLPMKVLGLSIETILSAPRVPSPGKSDRHGQIEQECKIGSKSATRHLVGPA
jgi:hypothetical protein